MTFPKDFTTEARLAERSAPSGSPVMYQRWDELLFLHWSFEPEVVARCLPPGLRVDTFDGRAWIGVVPFQMAGVRPRFLPAVPGISNFPELNLRTYVLDEKGRPGVWFYSLDTPKRFSNWIARTFFHLNYRLSRMRVVEAENTIQYQSELHSEQKWDRCQRYEWQRTGDTFVAEPGSLEFFLAERYRLFAYNPKRDRLLTGRVQHVPYPLQRAKLDAFSTRLFSTNGIDEPGAGPESILASAGVDVRIYPMEGV